MEELTIKFFGEGIAQEPSVFDNRLTLNEERKKIRIPVRRASRLIYSRERCREQRWTLWPVAYFAAFQLKSVQNYRKLNKLPPPKC